MKFPFNRVSASMINAYIDCPRGFKLVHIDELMTEEGPALEIGSILDFMFKTYHQKKDWMKEAKKKFITGRVNKERITNFGKARELMEIYVKTPDKFKNPEFDIRFEVPITHPDTGETIPGIVLKGFLDGFDEGRIKELKSTTQPYDQDKVDYSLQATCYAYGLYVRDNKIYPIDYIVLGKKTRTVDRLSTTRELSDFSNLFETIKSVIQDIEAEKFDANDDHPFYCPCRKL